jgi:hypothetical protein
MTIQKIAVLKAGFIAILLTLATQANANEDREKLRAAMLEKSAAEIPKYIARCKAALPALEKKYGKAIKNSEQFCDCQGKIAYPDVPMALRDAMVDHKFDPAQINKVIADATDVANTKAIKSCPTE